MRTIGKAYEERGTDERNNFLLIRLVAASLVIYGHSFAFSKPDGSNEFFSHFLGYMYAGDVGVNIFFVVSGFLVTASYAHTRNLKRFAASRLIRIYPALLAFILLTAFVVGPQITPLSLTEYFSSKTLHSYVFYNLTFANYFGDLPVDFVGSRFPHTVAGVLWTIVIEVRLYLLIGLMGALGIFRNQTTTNIALIAIIVSPFVLNMKWFLIFANADNLRVSILFLVGALIFVNRNGIPLNIVILAAVTLILAFLSGDFYRHAFTAALVYAVFLFAFAPKIKLPRWIQDYSYGIYLYGWIVQQLIHFHLPDFGPNNVFILSMIGASGCAVLSWFLVEKPSLKLKNLKIASPLSRGVTTT